MAEYPVRAASPVVVCVSVNGPDPKVKSAVNVSGVDDGVGNVEPSVSGDDAGTFVGEAGNDALPGLDASAADVGGLVDGVLDGAGMADDAVEDAVDDDEEDFDEHEVTATTSTPMITHGRSFDARTFTQPPFTCVTEIKTVPAKLPWVWAWVCFNEPPFGDSSTSSWSSCTGSNGAGTLTPPQLVVSDPLPGS